MPPQQDAQAWRGGSPPSLLSRSLSGASQHGVDVAAQVDTQERCWLGECPQPPSPCLRLHCCLFADRSNMTEQVRLRADYADSNSMVATRPERWERGRGWCLPVLPCRPSFPQLAGLALHTQLLGSHSGSTVTLRGTEAKSPDLRTCPPESLRHRHYLIGTGENRVNK